MPQLLLCASHTVSVALRIRGYNLHGHDLRVDVCVKPEDWRLPMPLDLEDLRNNLIEILKPLDHNLVNAVLGVEDATGEVIALWVSRKLEEKGFKPNIVRVWLGGSAWVEVHY